MAPEPNFELLMHVPMRLTAELGTCTMSIAEILQISAGSIIELDRAATAPVDVRINDRLVARGEIVAVEGNFGLVVTEVLHSDPTPTA
ncbi:MAG: flagellar motor switch protein FliN [Candidatus Eremiobacteraeota bacterium]|nr:flagellar motor switch protein FliN [Candidatus Eremiobacteraeota bacterium]